MPSKPLIGTLLVAAVVAALLAACGGGESDNSPMEARELGFYPPAPSTAEGMTSEWREFADEVDRICATSYNQAMGLEGQIDQVAAIQDWSGEAVVGL